MSKENPNIIFMGTPEFAVPALEKVHKKFGVKAVVTVPDKPKGRGKKLTGSAVKEKAAGLGLDILQPEKLKDPVFIERLKSLEPDIIVVIAFRILPAEVYERAALGAFNIHGSLLPKYRGAAPINWAVINGESETGLTSFLLKKKVDTGDILLQERINIPENSTAGDVHDMLMPHAARMAVDTCNLLISGNYQTMPQDDSQASPAPKIFRESCRINWDQHARDLSNFINGVSPVPGAWTIFEGKTIKILRTIYTACGVSIPGKFIVKNNTLTVQCGKGMLSVLEIQQQGKRAMRTEDFLKGWRGGEAGNFE